MTIQILPPQLANQIAAGEVVERPASVIKELVENSLDAGATRVDIEIEKGGSKLIKIHDDGSGIPKEELSLALSRHATSKLSTLDDLDAILSFGFRGEALASISSVSRLTLTSRTAEQSEAWQAYAEGSDMAVKVIPAAHPVGSTVEAVDLFFNTPARRRFLKSDKTEFTHIDEWLKRIALVRRDIHFTFKNNGKLVRNYRAAKTWDQYLQRLAQICGKKFVEQSLQVECEHEGLNLSGFIQSPYFDGPACDTQYFYVNGRLVRDRLVNHAVRQAFAEHVSGVQASFVLMLELDPHQVDVNVHPAKHEVRFHQSRYVHDFILQALQSALSQVSQSVFSDAAPSDRDVSSSAYQADIQPVLAVNETDELNPVTAAKLPFDKGLNTSPQARQHEYSITSSSSYPASKSGLRPSSASRPQAELPSAAAIASYGALLTTPVVPAMGRSELVNDLQGMPPVLDARYWVLTQGDKLTLLAIQAVASRLLQISIFAKLEDGLISQPLLMPVSISMDDDWKETIERRELVLRKIGIELTIRLGQLIIKKVPPYLRQSQLVSVIPELLHWLRFEAPGEEALASWLAKHCEINLQAPAQIWQDLMLAEQSLREELMADVISLPWQVWLEKGH